MRHSRDKRHEARKAGIVQQLKALWRFVIGLRSSRSVENRRFSARVAHGRQHESGRAFMERVGEPNASAGGDRADSLIRFSPGRMVLVGFVLIGLMWVGWRIVADTAGYNAATSDPETALAWTSSEAGALDELAYREFTKSDGDLNIARNLAERALRSNPLDARALAVLGLIAERQGEQARAGSLMRLSGARTWRDMSTQAWLLKYEIQSGDFEQALFHIDALLRTNPRFLAQTIPVFAAFTIDQRTFNSLASLLATNPPWRAGVLASLSAQLSDAGRLVQLYAALKGGQHPPEAAELRPYLDRLIKDGRYAEAYQSWRETLSPEQRTREFLLYNGDFAAPIDGLPFNWLLYPGQGVNIQIVASPGKDKGRALQFQFSGARVASFTVGQLMLLPPGEYHFTGEVRAEELRTERGLEWQISCADSPNNILARTDLVAHTTLWTGFSVVFTVPQQDCRSQWLKLEIASRTASERQIEGQVWYDNLQIGRATSGNSLEVR
jgi:tetratricopeptide (TPR) repeat protein